MKLKIYYVAQNDLQDYLDKYEDKIKFILRNDGLAGSDNLYILIIDEA